jgi:hypothetical protein
MNRYVVHPWLKLKEEKVLIVGYYFEDNQVHVITLMKGEFQLLPSISTIALNFWKSSICMTLFMKPLFCISSWAISLKWEKLVKPESNRFGLIWEKRPLELENMTITDCTAPNCLVYILRLRKYFGAMINFTRTESLSTRGMMNGEQALIQW